MVAERSTSGMSPRVTWPVTPSTDTASPSSSDPPATVRVTTSSVTVTVTSPAARTGPRWTTSPTPVTVTAAPSARSIVTAPDTSMSAGPSSKLHRGARVQGVPGGGELEVEAACREREAGAALPVDATDRPGDAGGVDRHRRVVAGALADNGQVPGESYVAETEGDGGADDAGGVGRDRGHRRGSVRRTSGCTPRRGRPRGPAPVRSRPRRCPLPAPPRRRSAADAPRGR